MRIRYLDNSGFALELGQRLLVIDYYNLCAPRIALESGIITDEYIRSFESVTVLASHVHPDHFTKEIFRWRELAKNVEYLMSFDIKMQLQTLCERAELIAPGESKTVGGFEVTAFRSTDEGVAFHIRTDGMELFHAGDFNFWHWQEEADEAYVHSVRKEFEGILQQIRAAVPRLDIAFFPIDPRMGRGYYMGASMFVDAMRPKKLYPMHFGQSFQPPQEFLQAVAGKTELVPISRRGQVFEEEFE